MNTAKQNFQEHLLSHPTWPEKILWSRLRSKGIGYYFQRQAIVRGFVVDFWCPSAKLAIELDGPVHDFAAHRAADAQRDDLLKRSGVEVLRFPNSDVRKGMSAVLIRIWEHCYGRDPEGFRPNFGATESRRYCGNEDFSALRAYQQAKFNETQVSRFSLRSLKRRQKLFGKLEP